MLNDDIFAYRLNLYILNTLFESYFLLFWVKYSAERDEGLSVSSVSPLEDPPSITKDNPQTGIDWHVIQAPGLLRDLFLASQTSDVMSPSRTRPSPRYEQEAPGRGDFRGGLQLCLRGGVLRPGGVRSAAGERQVQRWGPAFWTLFHTTGVALYFVVEYMNFVFCCPIFNFFPHIL